MDKLTLIVTYEFIRYWAFKNSITINRFGICCYYAWAEKTCIMPQSTDVVYVKFCRVKKKFPTRTQVGDYYKEYLGAIVDQLVN